MKLQVELPQLQTLGSYDFEDFCEVTGSFFETVDPAETLDAIDYTDIAEAESHPNGFYIIRLSDVARKPEGQIRVHIWQQDNDLDRSDGEIHKHPWHLASKVLFGKYVEQIAGVIEVSQPEAANYTSIRMERDSLTGNNRYVDPRLVNVTLSEPQEHEAGTTHFLPEEAYHLTPISAEALVITMPIMGRMFNDQRRFLELIGLKTKPVEDLHHKATKQEIDFMWQQIEAAKETLS